MADKKITDLPTLIQADSGDYIAIVDSSANITKKVPAERLIPAAGSGVAGNLVSDASGVVSVQSIPYGSIGFSTYSTTGGQVVGATVTALLFNTVLGSLIDVTNPANGQLQVVREGSYSIALQTNVADTVQTNNAVGIEVSVDGGTTWRVLTPLSPNTSVGATSRGLSASAVTWLPANGRVRGTYYSGGGSTRIAAPDAVRTAVCSLSIKG